LDRELVAAYQLRVLVEDCPWIDHKCLSQTGITTNSSISLTILVTDVNDNPPRFARRHFFAALHVDNNNVQAGEAVIQLRATDPDEGDRGRLRFGWGEGMVQTDGDVRRGKGTKGRRGNFLPMTAPLPTVHHFLEAPIHQCSRGIS
jgi:hypothetical protein